MTEKKAAKTKKQTLKKKPVQKSKKAKTDISNQKKELDLLIDKHVRLKAEFENFRKRKNKEISALLQYDGESVIKEVLPIFDDLNRLVESAEVIEDKNENALINCFKRSSTLLACLSKDALEISSSKPSSANFLALSVATA